ncbi:site-specific DNA methylase [Thermobacillus composti KWC4]|jgi:Site-specific DNA methylase|uniref:Site-specific DNA methylase n=2 Tax=Thermobacillus TaxID=76632 RepID=L0EGT0_THECK|nr:site-specific DNA methylase [Thermobacillus composti KWC4]
MATSFSPLRYPGGKNKIYKRVVRLIEKNNYDCRTYVEPFAGGFSIGIGLLSNGIVSTAVLNDYDRHIYNFWYSLFHFTDELVKKIYDTPITIEERKRQLAIYNDPSADTLSDGFATLFLNRVNYSGIIKGGPIGGQSQAGKYKLDCRFNKTDLSKRIEKVALLKDRIYLFNYDASELITKHLKKIKNNAFFNIDPPYVAKGYRLYTNFFKEDDHRNFERIISKHLKDNPWIVTYDDCELIRNVYAQYHMEEYRIQHNAGGSALGKELVITNIPKESFVW